MSREWSLTLDGVTYKIAVDGNSILVNGQPFVVGFDEQGDTGKESTRVLVDGISYDVSLSPEGDRVMVGGIAYDLFVEGLDREQSGRVRSDAGAAAGRPAVAAGAGAVKAIMPGKIIRVLVAEGDAVAEGDVICILEAMKMENELKAPQAGTVKALYIQPGQDVESGAVLADIE
jgi:acetyl/propionyl-CoA carboxylase alpha subunit